MNERIRELEKQAYVEVTQPWRDPGSGYVQEITTKEFSREKFALLIVQECMRMCEVAQVGYLTHGLEKEASGAISVKQYIEDYLGVEQ
jgi:hypothetical protein